MRRRWLLCAVSLLVIVASALGAYYWPTPSAPLPPASPADVPLVLPTEAETRTAEELREEAELAVADLLKRYPQSPAGHKSAAMLYQTLNQFERVTEHWKQCIALAPTDIAAHEWLAKAQLRLGEDEAAGQTLEIARSAGLRTAELCVQAAIVAQRRGQLAEAEKIAQQGLADFPDHADLLVALGQAQLQSSKFEAAKDSFERALRTDSDSTAAHVGLANACQRLGDKATADTHRARVEELVSARRKGALSFEEEYEQTLRLAVAAALSSAGTIYDEHGEWNEAERLCQRAYAIHPGYPDSYRQLANMYHRRGMIERAIVVQQRLAQLEPENDSNHVNLASLMFRAGRARDGEATLLAGARAAPQSAVIPQSLAAIYLQNGQLAKAREFAQQAAHLAPTPERYRLLAEICRQLADLPAADAALAAASKLTSPVEPLPGQGP